METELSIDDAVSIIKSVSGFADEDTPVGQAWATVQAALRSMLDENRQMREALQIQQDESDLQQQGYKLCDNPDHPLFVKWLGPSKPGESGYDRHFQMSALRRAMRIAALARADAVGEENP